MFDGTLGKHTDFTIGLKEDAKPYHAKPFPVRKAHELTIKKEVNRLIKIGVLRNINNFQWVAPPFIIPKINGTVRFISDFTDLNQRIKTKPIPIPKQSRYIT